MNHILSILIILTTLDYEKQINYLLIFQSNFISIVIFYPTFFVVTKERSIYIPQTINLECFQSYYCMFTNLVWTRSFQDKGCYLSWYVFTPNKCNTKIIVLICLHGLNSQVDIYGGCKWRICFIFFDISNHFLATNRTLVNHPQAARVRAQRVRVLR